MNRFNIANRKSIKCVHYSLKESNYAREIVGDASDTTIMKENDVNECFSRSCESGMLELAFKFYNAEYIGQFQKVKIWLQEHFSNAHMKTRTVEYCSTSALWNKLIKQ